MQDQPTLSLKGKPCNLLSAVPDFRNAPSTVWKLSFQLFETRPFSGSEQPIYQNEKNSNNEQVLVNQMLMQLAFAIHFATWWTLPSIS
jgi:hypothetical protein